MKPLSVPIPSWAKSPEQFDEICERLYIYDLNKKLLKLLTEYASHTVQNAYIEIDEFLSSQLTVHSL